ncbi:GNAT family N-acetyltransferase [Symbioplanes lichenis]|uniref:GNAT family N-acetyltransferase n=1 Tax=Symbioplanes lichenis TaxID=1629072 RepID=UPI00273A560B|nr:GNAT family N-acetyltransferase [Actinoplanes lichenis]
MTKTSLTTHYFDDPLGGLGDRQWDEMAGDHFYSSAFWLRLCTSERAGPFGGVHVEVPGGGRAAVPVIAVGDDPHPNTRWDTLLAARGLPSPPPHGTLVGQLRGYLAHVLSTPDAAPEAAAAELLAAVRSAAAPVPAGERAQVALYLTTPDVLRLQAAGVTSPPVALAADAWIEIPAGGWEAWLASLGSSHRARRIRSEVRKFEQAGYRIRQQPLSEAYEDVARLTAATVHRYGKRADVAANTEAFRKQGLLAGPRAQVLLCDHDDGTPPVACCLYYRAGDTVYLRAVGFEYDRLRGAAEYFNLAYYIPARLPGVRMLHAGMSTPDGKALRGAQLRPLWLLDLSERSVLAGHADQVSAHNAAFRERLAGTSPAVARSLRTELWQTLF